MKRFRRWLFNGLAVLSLLLCLATAALWVRSYLASDQLNWRNRRYFAMAETYQGVVEISLSGWMTFRLIPNGWQFFTGPYEPPREHLAIHRERPPQGHGGWDRWLIVLPIWLLLFIPALPLGAWWKYRNRINLPIAGACPKCGYDLRATPDRCPECGTIPSIKEIISS